MVRRSDHCLPSDSDKFTIKLHSLPSKFLSSSSCLPAFLPLFCSLATLSSPPHPLAAGASSLRTRGSSSGGALVYSLAITITLGTPAPPCPSVHQFSLCSFLLSARSSTTFSLSSMPVFRSVYVCTCVSAFPLASSRRFFAVSSSSSCPSWPDHPVASATAIPQLFSSFLALVAVAAVAGDFTCLPLPAVLYRGVSFFLCFSLFSCLVVHPFLPFAVGHPASVSIPRPMSHLLTFLPSFLDFFPPPPFHSRNGHRNS